MMSEVFSHLLSHDELTVAHSSSGQFPVETNASAMSSAKSRAMLRGCVKKML